MRPRTRSVSLTLSFLTMALAAPAGCEEPRHVAGEANPQAKKAVEA